ncbi:DUF742 domain-containing protein [Streptomyces sp. NPDC088124]|uniref:DUF742 domain-containing protein n=1 Tax=Streptomyces sp. NPDC088124 TaxID=3154654 RepID=UPI003434A782
MSGARHVRDSSLVRPYVVTGGRSAPSRNTFNQITLIRLYQRDLPRAALAPEARGVLDLCATGALSVAEIASGLKLPVSVLRIVLADLMESGYITTGPNMLQVATPDRGLLEAVLAGLERL